MGDLLVVRERQVAEEVKVIIHPRSRMSTSAAVSDIRLFSPRERQTWFPGRSQCKLWLGIGAGPEPSLCAPHGLSPTMTDLVYHGETLRCRVCASAVLWAALTHDCVLLPTLGDPVGNPPLCVLRTLSNGL